MTIHSETGITYRHTFDFHMLRFDPGLCHIMVVKTENNIQYYSLNYWVPDTRFFSYFAENRPQISIQVSRQPLLTHPSTVPYCHPRYSQYSTPHHTIYLKY